ncbi:MAG: cell division protein ZapA [Emcibacter sp.]|nr:cell division protein ZapA [Emcibacter sp.]
MANVTVKFNNRDYQLACQGGGEARLEKLAEYVIDKASEISKATGSVSDIRLMLMTAILLADELDEARDGKPMAQKETQDETNHLSETIAHTIKRIEGITRLIEAEG